ncbi:MAG: DUF4349 domain-containing protein [Chloroflexi bacterium]|nr:DUF4349 domain-containing protein [Chloroflexota bacterium]
MTRTTLSGRNNWSNALRAVLGVIAAGTLLLSACGGFSRNVGSSVPGAAREPAGTAKQERSLDSLDARTDSANVAGAPAPAIKGQSAAATGAGQPAAAGAPAALPPIPSFDRMIVKTGSLTLEVTDLVEAVQRVGAIVAGIPGAYVAASSTSYRAESPPRGGGDGVRPLPAQSIIPIPPKPVPGPGQSASVTIKVPADSFGDALQQLRGTGKPLSEHVSTQEVTEEFVDLEAQVRNLEATEQQFLALLQRAQKIEEILPIQQRITDIRGQIERLRGRMQLLQRRADVSTITVSLVLPAHIERAQPAGEPHVVRTLRVALANLRAVVLVLLDAAIYVAVYALPLVPLVLAFLWWHRTRRTTPSPGGVV